jgi:hypothetical protein
MLQGGLRVGTMYGVTLLFIAIVWVWLAYRRRRRRNSSSAGSAVLAAAAESSNLQEYAGSRTSTGRPDRGPTLLRRG